MALEDEIIARLNQELGKDLKNLKKANIVLKQHHERLKEIRGKVTTRRMHCTINLIVAQQLRILSCSLLHP